jgi:hypothetical protein
MKFFGVWTSVALYILLYLISLFGLNVLFNRLSLEVNLFGLLIICNIFFFLIAPRYKKNRKRINIIYIILTAVVLNLALGFFINLAEQLKEESDSDDMSFILILPGVLIVAVIWGWVYDKIKNRPRTSND